MTKFLPTTPNVFVHCCKVFSLASQHEFCNEWIKALKNHRLLIKNTVL